MNVGSGGSDSQDFELNLASLIDCFTVLITFMLASASFLSIGLLDAGIAAAGATSAAKSEPPPVNIAIELAKDESFVIKITGKENRTVPISAKGGHWDLEGLALGLTEVKGRWKD